MKFLADMARSIFEMLILEACSLKTELRQAMEREFRKSLLAEERELVFGVRAVTLAYPDCFVENFVVVEINSGIHSGDGLKYDRCC